MISLAFDLILSHFPLRVSSCHLCSSNCIKNFEVFTGMWLSISVPCTVVVIFLPYSVIFKITCDIARQQIYDVLFQRMSIIFMEQMCELLIEHFALCYSVMIKIEVKVICATRSIAKWHSLSRSCMHSGHLGWETC